MFTILDKIQFFASMTMYALTHRGDNYKIFRWADWFLFFPKFAWFFSYSCPEPERCLGEESHHHLGFQGWDLYITVTEYYDLKHKVWHLVDMIHTDLIIIILSLILFYIMYKTSHKKG